ncbi:chemotaxis protein CheW [Herbaspirillum sp. CF444]|uniref:chemotaxis protein CheW n=1 Tax=Herbaspirillum sp. CF444 TaxID=1144319 RepID=UPI0009D9F9CA|nr:chemotaxis protein CheW [Herbaspirillum sp. CF444]
MSRPGDDSRSELFLVFRCDLRLCALPVEHIVETMRSLPIEPMPDMPVFLLGVSIIRGAVMPVIDVACLLGSGDAPIHARHARFVTLKLGARRIAFAVDDVVGVRSLSMLTAEISPLLGAADTSLVEAMSILDAELILILQAARVISDAAWAALDLQGGPR